MIDFSSTVVELSGDSEKQKEVQDIAKCLRTLYSTPIGSQEGDRELGINPNIFVDKPLPVAKGLYVAEVTEKTASFEPRARVVRVDWLDSDVLHYYQCIYDAELSDSTSELVPVGVVSPGSFYTTTKAGVLNGCETHDGFIRFFAQRIPEADIQATVTLFGKGGGSGETGSVSIGQGLKRDASGAIAVRIGEGLDFDSANALTVRKETVMTSEDLLDEEETQQEIVDMLK
jgi:phage baseplate assembly protein W